MTPEDAARRDELRTRIARLRRRLDRHAGRAAERSLLLFSWRSYVEKNPGRALLTAAGLGMALSSVLTAVRSQKESTDA